MIPCFPINFHAHLIINDNLEKEKGAMVIQRKEKAKTYEKEH